MRSISARGLLMPMSWPNRDLWQGVVTIAVLAAVVDGINRSVPATLGTAVAAATGMIVLAVYRHIKARRQLLDR